ncbi:hypothetical protein, partial [Sphingomonas sp.]|uniref:hypothetical protein n=1 Tax=Sphingomonas sp. TaxID=28214 RepID=UPI00286D89BE
MIEVWAHYWGLFAAAVVIGLLTGWRGFRPLRVKRAGPANDSELQALRRRHRNRMFAIGTAATVALAALV